MASPGKAWVYDGDGNPVSVNAGQASEETFTHDFAGRLRGYTNAASSTTASYLSDPSARRIRKTVDGTTTWFLWDGDHLLAEFDASGNRTRRYTYTGGFAPAEQVVVTGPSSEVVERVHADHLDTPRGLSSGAGVAVWRAAYRAFGGTTPNEDPDGDFSEVSFAIRFPGQYADPESELYDNLWRDYNPTLGRYAQSDPLGQNLWGNASPLETVRAPTWPLPLQPLVPTANDFLQANVYAYAASRPTTVVDPRGLQILVCSRKAFRPYNVGNHSYLWDTRTGMSSDRKF